MNNTPQPQPTGSSDDEKFWQEIEELALLVRTVDEDHTDIAVDNLLVRINSTMTRNSKVKADRQKALQRANRTLRLAALKQKGEMAKAVTAARIDPFDFVGPCEPECSSERHAYHQGQWDMATRIKEFTDQEEIE